MLKNNKIRLSPLLFSAFLVASQAVFLLVFNLFPAKAQTESFFLSGQYNQEVTPGTVDLSWDFGSSYSNTYGGYIFKSNQPGLPYTNDPSLESLYFLADHQLSYQWRENLNHDSTYYFRICLLGYDQTCYIYSNEIQIYIPPSVLIVDFIDLPLTISGTVNIEAQTNFPADSVLLSIFSNWGEDFSEDDHYDGDYVYSFTWDTFDVLDGIYNLNLLANKSGGHEADNSKVITVNNSVQSMSINILSPSDQETISGIINIQAESNIEIEANNISLYINGEQNNLQPMHTSSTTIYTFSWDTNNYINGDYDVQVSAIDSSDNLINDNITVTVNNSNTQPCSVSCSTSPGCRVLLINGIAVSGECCDSTASCYTCAPGFIWDGADCVADCNNNCDGSCDSGCSDNSTGIIDPDCGCIDNNNCCGAGCDNFNDNDCIFDDYENNYSIEFLDAPKVINESIIVSAQSSFTPDQIYFIVSGSKDKNYQGIPAGANKYYFRWDVSEFSYGDYNIKVLANKEGNIFQESIVIKHEEKKNIIEEPIIESQEGNQTANNTEDEISIEIENDDSEVNRTSSIDEKENEQQIIPEDSIDLKDNLYDTEENVIFPECEGKKIFTKEECQLFLSLPNECREKSFKTLNECENYLSIPRLCREKSLREEECKEYLRIPFECRETGIDNEKECIEHRYQNSLPEACVKDGIKTHEECSRFIIFKSMPKVCQVAQAETKEECDKILGAIRNLSPECQEAGILNETVCHKYIFENYGNIINITERNLPQECLRENIKTAQECKDYINKKYLPNECKEQGITEEEQCKYYLKQKELSNECRKAGITSKKECNNFMIKNYSIKHCVEAGVEDREECNDFLFNKYIEKVECEGDAWQCNNSIKERHLGDIDVKQTKYNELKEKAKTIETSIKVKEFNKLLSEAKGIIPIKEEDTGLKIIATEDKIILDKNDNLKQSSPVGIMIDSDEDGLPDDIEKRLGTDPKNPDSDNDGYKDGEEVANNYNPLGPGKLKKEIAGVDEAIINNKTLEQPKTSGKTEEGFLVTKIINKEEKENQDKKNYLLKGQAEAGSIVTIYLYSDLPIIATVETDEFGNWEYLFDKTLEEGGHEVYIALNDNTGKVLKKSKPYNFFIKEAKAVTVSDFVAVAAAKPLPRSDSLMVYYLIVAAIIIILGIFAFIIFFRIHKKKHQYN